MNSTQGHTAVTLVLWQEPRVGNNDISLLSLKDISFVIGPENSGVARLMYDA